MLFLVAIAQQSESTGGFGGFGVVVGLVLLGMAIIVVVLMAGAARSTSGDTESQDSDVPDEYGPALFGTIPDGFVGVVLRWGKARKRAIRSGRPYVLIPLLHKLVLVNIQKRRIETKPLELVLDDGTVRVDTMLRVRVTDAAHVYRELEDVDELVADEALTVGMQAISQYKITDLRSSEISDHLLQGLNQRLASLGGVVAEAFQISDFDLPASVEEAYAQHAAAVIDAKADRVRANNEPVLARRYRISAAIYFGLIDEAEVNSLLALEDADSRILELLTGLSAEDKALVGVNAIELRRLATYEDMRPGGAIIPSS